MRGSQGVRGATAVLGASPGVLAMATRPRPTDVQCLVAWIAYGSQAEAAYSLGITTAAFGHRMCRMYRRAHVHSVYALLLTIPDRGMNVVWRPAEARRTL